MSKKISVILPVYNVEKYIARCLDSIVNQTYKNIEIIVVDDGSSDNSGKICEEYKQRDNRIKVLHIDNVGVSNARNIALQEVSGEYIQFVDSDDYIEKEMLQEMAECMDNNTAELMVTGFINQEETFSDLVLPEEEGKYNIHEYAGRIMKTPYSFIYGVLWNKLFRADIVKENNIAFTAETNFGEDFIFVLEYLKYVTSVFVLRKGFYHYVRYNTNSLMYIQSKKNDAEEYCLILKKRLVIYHYYMEFYKKIGMYEENKNKINEYMLGYWVGRYRVFFSNMSWKEKKICRRFILENKELKQCISDIDKNYRIKRELLYWFQIFKKNVRVLYIEIKKKRKY